MGSSWLRCGCTGIRRLDRAWLGRILGNEAKENEVVENEAMENETTPWMRLRRLDVVAGSEMLTLFYDKGTRSTGKMDVTHRT